jgi:trigger factor
VSPSTTTASAWPKLDAPPEYRDLEVVVPLPPPVTAGELLERHHRQRWAAATRRQRGPGEAVAMGDAVVVDILGYANGRMIPFSARFQHELELWDDPILPGFARQVAGTRIPGKATVKLALPPDYPVESLRGAEATFLVTVLGSAEVTLPPEDPSAMEALAEELMREQDLDLEREAQEVVLDHLAARAEVEVPEALVDAEIRHKWLSLEGLRLADLGLDADDQEEALEGWRSDPGLRTQTERSMRVFLALQAIFAAEQLELTGETRVALLAELLSGAGTVPQVLDALAQDRREREKVELLMRQLVALGHVMSHVRVRYEPAPAPAAAS